MENDKLTLVYQRYDGMIFEYTIDKAETIMEIEKGLLKVLNEAGWGLLGKLVISVEDENSESVQ